MTSPKNPNHAPKGADIKADPIRSKRAINNIKKLLADQPRDLCLFTLGINTAYRGNELLGLTVGDVRHLSAGDYLTVKQSKNQKHRTTPLNQTTIDAIQHWLNQSNAPRADDQPLFISQRGTLTVGSASRLVKQWCKDVGLRGNYSSHTLRKTWGYMQRIKNGAPMSLLCKAYGHSSEQVTMRYLGIQEKEIDQLYELEL